MGWLADFMFGKAEGGNEPTKGTREDGDNVSPKEEPEGRGVEDVYRTTSGTKVVPEVIVSRVEPRLNNGADHLELWAELYNTSSFEVEVRKFEVLEQWTELGRFLKPGEKHEVKVYSGEPPHREEDRKAVIQYRIKGNGDYFQSDHMIMYKQDSGRFIPYELRLIRPVRDI